VLVLITKLPVGRAVTWIAAMLFSIHQANRVTNIQIYENFKINFGWKARKYID
jgi:hypothetical protein